MAAYQPISGISQSYRLRMSFARSSNVKGFHYTHGVWHLFMEPEVCTGESGFGAFHQSDDFICSRRRNQAIIDAGISFDELLDVSLLAVLYRFTSVCKLPQLDLARSQTDGRSSGILRLASKGCPWLFSSNHKKRRMRCSGETWNEWNICSTSHTAATSSRQKRTSTPSRVFIRSGPASSSRLRDLPWYSVEESKTTRICSGFFRWYTSKWGRYHTCPGD